MEVITIFKKCSLQLWNFQRGNRSLECLQSIKKVIIFFHRLLMASCDLMSPCIL